MYVHHSGWIYHLLDACTFDQRMDSMKRMWIVPGLLATSLAACESLPTGAEHAQTGGPRRDGGLVFGSGNRTQTDSATAERGPLGFGSGN